MASNQTALPNVSETEETLLSGTNENVYEDQNIGAELTKKDINRVAWRSMLLQASFNYERMQASGWLYGLLPALKKIHTNKRDLARSMKGHMGFFNTHPFPGHVCYRDYPGDGTLQAGCEQYSKHQDCRGCATWRYR